MNDLTDDLIYNIVIYADDATLYSKCEQAFDLWQYLELDSELEWLTWYTINLGWKWLVDFDARKTQLISFDRSSTSGANDLKIDESVF